MHWFYTALLIAISASTVGFAGHLVRRLFTTPPAPPAPVPGDVESDARS